jgi:hypothetical protein
VNNYQELEVWQKSKNLAIAAYKVTEALRRSVKPEPRIPLLIWLIQLH